MNPLDVLKAKVPAGTKRQVRKSLGEAERWARRPFKQSQFHSALEEISRSAPTAPPNELLQQLVDGWDNPAAGDVGYLRTVIDLAQAAEGPILECGSGLTTFLLQAYAAQPVWTLEADERWYRRVRKELSGQRFENGVVVHAPLEDFGDFFWYRVPDTLPSTFSLVICDGPAAGGLKGGRVGLFPVLGERIVSGALVVVDRAMVYEGEVLAAWEADYGLTVVDPSTEHRVYRRP